jgi:serine/threonine-protein kinase
VLPAQTDPEPEPEEKSKRWLWITLSVIAALAVGGIIWLLAQDREPEVTMATVPNVAGQTEAEAVAALTEAGFEYSRQEEPSADVDEGAVTRSDPAGGEQAEEGSTVTFWVSSGPNAVTVPDVVGLTQEAARAQIEEVGLTVGSVEQQNDPSQPQGRALGTDPAAQQQISPDQPVTLFISSGNVELPDLRGQAQTDAVNTLNGLNLVSNIVQEETSEAAPGTVIAQDRAAGIVQQRSTVVLTVAAAPTTVAIPQDIVGKTEADATAQLQALGLTVESIASDGPSSQPVGTVISSDPSPGRTVDIGSTVTLILSAGPGTTEDGNAGD